MQYLKQGAQEADKHGVSRVRAENYNFTGVIYRNLGDYTKAMENFTKAYSMSEINGYKREEGYALNNIGDVYKYQRSFDKARQYVLRSLAIFQALKDSSGLHYCYIRLGEIAEQTHQYDSALEAFRVSMKYAIWADNPIWQAGAQNRIGQVYALQGAYPKAIEAFKEGLFVSERFPNNEDETAMIFIQIGRTYLTARKHDSARAYLRKGFAVAERIGSKQHIREASKYLAQMAQRNGNDREHAQFLTLQLIMTDSLFNESGRREIERMMTKYEMDKQQTELDTLNIAQEQQRNIGIILVVGILFLVVIAVLLALNIRNERRSKAEILRQQEILHGQSVEIETNNVLLHERNAQLVALNNDKTEILNIVAHDLKNPIGAIRTMAELMLFGEQTVSVLNTTAHHILTTSNRMFTLVTDMLAINRLDEGGIEFALVEIDIIPMISECYEQYSRLAETKHITLHLDNPY
jgi:signal transduction histidine kinase